MIANQDSAKLAKAEYYRRWREKNRDKVRQYNENYWKRKAARGDEKHAEVTSAE